MTTECQLRESPFVEPALSVDSALLEPVACGEFPGGWDHDDFQGAAEMWASFCRFFLRCSSEVVPAYIPLGVPLWLDIDGPLGRPRIQRLFFCHDVGGAIKGRLRGDIDWGRCEQAGHLAGAIQSQGHTLLIAAPIAAQSTPLFPFGNREIIDFGNTGIIHALFKRIVNIFKRIIVF